MARIGACLKGYSDLTVTPLNQAQLGRSGLTAEFAATSEGTQYLVKFWNSPAAAARDVGSSNGFAQQVGSIEVNPRPGADQVGQEVARCVRGA